MIKKTIFLFITLSIIAILILTFLYNNRQIEIKKYVEIINKYIENKDYENAKTITLISLNKYTNDIRFISLLENIQTKIKIEEKIKQQKQDKDINDKFRLVLTLLNSLPLQIDKYNKQYIKELLDKDKNTYSLDSVALEKVDTLLKQAISLYNKQLFDESIKLLNEVIKVDPNNAVVKSYLSANIFNQNPNDNKKIEVAIKYAKESLQIDNSLEESHLTLAKIYEIREINRMAIDEYNEVLKYNPNSYLSFYRLGQISLKQNNIKESIAYFNRVLKIKSDYSDSMYFLAISYLKDNQIEMALKYFLDCIKNNSSSFDSYSQIASIYRIKKEYSNAIEYYKKAYETSKRVVFLLKMAKLYELVDDKPNQNICYELIISQSHIDSLEERQTLIEAYESVINLYISKKNYEESMKILKKGLSYLRVEYDKKNDQKFDKKTVLEYLDLIKGRLRE